MKVVERKYDIELTDQFQTKTFGMEINAKAFDILVNKIYTDKIGAIVRELSANAYDSHVDAGKRDTPFLLHLPNNMEPYFFIRDFGTGISEEKMYEVYTTVFRSDKTNSNEFVGCMGLGSKTPFCYTDQFTIISYYNGVQYCYFAHKDSKGIPSISASTDNGTPTNEPNGLKVMFTVNESSDFSNFKDKVEQYLRYYAVKPLIVGNSCKFPIESIVYEDEEFRVLADNGNDPTVLMGNIPYKIGDMSFCNRKYNNIVFKVPIGAIEIEASREGIENVQANETYLVRQFSKVIGIINDIYREYKDKAQASATCNWDRHLAENSIYKIASNFLHNVGTEFSFNMPHGTCKHQCVSNLRYKSRVWSFKPRPIVNVNDITKYDDPMGRVIFVRYSTEMQLKKRQADWLYENFGDISVISFVPTHEADVIKHFEITSDYVTDVADIPLVPIKPRVKKAAVPISGWKKFKGNSHYQGRCWTPDSSFDITKHPLCCRKNESILIGSVEYSPVVVHKLLESIACREPFYGLNISEYKKYTQSNTPIDFSEWFKIKVEAFITQHKIDYESKVSYFSLNYDDKIVYNFLKDAKAWLPKPIYDEIGCDNFIALKTQYNDENKYTSLYDFAKKLGINCTINVNPGVAAGISTYRQKFKMIDLVAHAPEHRDEFFRIFLGDINATKN